MNPKTVTSESRLNHSRLGIASVVIGVGIPIILVCLFALGILLGKSELAKYVGLAAVIFAVLSPLQHLIGSILGISGFFTNTKKLFPLIGTILNMLLGISGVLLIWLFLENMTWGFR